MSEAWSEPDGGFLTLQVPFKGSDLSVRISIKGDSLRKEHIERVTKYLELAAEDMDFSEIPAPAKAPHDEGE